MNIIYNNWQIDIFDEIENQYLRNINVTYEIIK